MASQSTVRTATLRGVEAIPVDAEVEIGAGLPSFAIVGLPDLAVQEARERVRSALRASGFEVPNSRVVVNLAPGPLRKHGTGFDLPIALGILAATGQLPRAVVESCVAVGELSLDGGLRPVPGSLAFALAACAARLPLLTAAALESSMPETVDYLPLRRLNDLRQGLPQASVAPSCPPATTFGGLQLADVKGHRFAKRGMLIAAAGGHNVLMCGPPGSGKSMLARALASILPPLEDAERLETALVHSVAGLPETFALRGERPFRSPHHSASIAGLIGGGSPPRPGEASLAHNGVLFLDEMPEFGPAALQAMRQPLEDGSVTLVRADGRLRYPARFALVGACNPCPCGYFGDAHRQCTCTPSMIARYQSRLGGPLMDRIDLQFRVDRIDPSLLLDTEYDSSCDDWSDLVRFARERARDRGLGPTATLQGARLLESCALDEGGRSALELAARHHHLSGRAVTRVLRVARTIADLEISQVVGRDHVAEALGYRREDTWG